MSHPHPHPHRHGHQPAGERRPAGGPVVLDIGDGFGAAIVHLDPRWVGEELHLHPADPSVPETHTGIWDRRIGNHKVVVAVFPELAAGTYHLHPPAEHHRTVTLEVTAGSVTELILR